VVAVVLETQPELHADSGALGTFFDVFEAFSVACFTVDFLARLFSAKFNPAVGHSVLGYLFSFYGAVDLLSIAPFYVGLAVSQNHSTVFRIFRLCRLFQLEHFMEAFTLLDDVFCDCSDILAATGLLALIIWLGAATLFYTFEQNNPNLDGAFDNIPDALYFTAIFLGGEWAVCDFTPEGKLVAMVLCIVGIALYAIPVGTIFESFGEILEQKASQLHVGDIVCYTGRTGSVPTWSEEPESVLVSRGRIVALWGPEERRSYTVKLHDGSDLEALAQNLSKGTDDVQRALAADMHRMQMASTATL